MNGRSAKRVFFSLLFIVAAVVLVMNQLGFLQGLGEFSVWRLILAAILVVCGIESVVNWNVPGFFFSIAFIGIIYAEPFGIQVLSPWTLLGAALLLSIGFSMLFKSARKRHFQKRYEEKYVGPNVESDSTIAGRRRYNSSQGFEDQEEVVSDTVSASTSFGSSVKYINSGNFRAADLHCSFGAMKVYFDKAVIQSGVAEVYVDASFAGMELYVPRTWKVVNNIDVSLAGVDEKNRSEAVGDTVLRLTGKASFSGITIIYI